jgi:hypothetical protein
MIGCYAIRKLLDATRIAAAVYLPKRSPLLVELPTTFEGLHMP